MSLRVRKWSVVGMTAACAISACGVDQGNGSEETSTEDISIVSTGEDIASTSEQLTLAEPLRGMYQWDAPYGPANLDSVAQWLGRDQDIGSGNQCQTDWSCVDGPDWQLSSWGKWVAAKPGRKFMYGIAPIVGSGGDNRGAGPDGKMGTADDVSLASCAAGAYDAHYKTLANNMVKAGLSGSIIRIGWEFDGSWFPWGAPGHEADFGACFRHIVTTMRAAQPSAGFSFNWNPTEDIYWWTTDNINKAYPGDAYVDSIGLDAYDTSWVANSYPYPTSCDSNCRVQHQTVAWNDLSRGMYLMRDFAVAHGKTVSFPEWGVWGRTDGHGGNDDPFYIQKMYDFFMDPNNHVAYQVYFDVDCPDGNHQLADVDVSGHTTTRNFATLFPQSAALFKTLFSKAPTPVVTPTPTPTPVADAGVSTVKDAGTTAVKDAGVSAPTPVKDAGVSTPAPTPTPTSTTLKIVNPGFESGTTGWKMAGSVSTSTSFLHSGKYGLLMVNGGDAEQDVMSQLSVGKNYKLTAYAGINQKADQAYLGMKFFNANGTVLKEYYTQITSVGVFAKSTLTFTVPTGATKAVAYAYSPSGTNAGAAFDDFVLSTN